MVVRTCASLRLRAFAISRLKSLSWFVDHAAESKSLRMTGFAVSIGGAALPPCVRSQTSNSFNNSRFDLGVLESQLAFHKFIHSV